MAFSRASFTVVPNGQTLIVSVATTGGTAIAFYTDAALTSQVTAPATVIAQTTYYVADDGYGPYVVSCKQADGTELYGVGLAKQQLLNGVTVAPLPSRTQFAADIVSGQVYAAGRENLPRYAAGTAVTMTSQTLRLAYLTAPASETIGSIAVGTNTTGAGATPSLVRFGIYTVAANGDVTLVASTTNDTALLSVASAYTATPLTVNYAVTAGSRYAIGALVVTAAAAPTLTGGLTSNGVSKLAPRLCASVTGQADLPAGPVSAATLDAAGSGALIWAALIPA